MTSCSDFPWFQADWLAIDRFHGETWFFRFFFFMLKVESLEAVREDTTGTAGVFLGVEVGGFEGKEGTEMVWFGLFGWFVCLLVCLVGFVVCLVGFFVCLLCLLVRLLGMSLPWVKPFTVKFRWPHPEDDMTLRGMCMCFLGVLIWSTDVPILKLT